MIKLTKIFIYVCIFPFIINSIKIIFIWFLPRWCITFLLIALFLSMLYSLFLPLSIAGPWLCYILLEMEFLTVFLLHYWILIFILLSRSRMLSFRSAIVCDVMIICMNSSEDVCWGLLLDFVLVFILVVFSIFCLDW